jgi:VWFA-related protein
MQFATLVRIGFAIPVVCLLSGQTAPPSNATQAADGLTLHIDVNLVQVDAVVTDRQGRAVTNLKPEDFEILEDGKPQPITNFSFIDLAATNNAAASPRKTTPGLPAPPEALKAENVNRTVVLVADDLNLSFESVALLRRTLKKFVDTQMGPRDLVSIARTSTGLGALGDFTNDKRELAAAVDAVRWYPMGLAGISAVPPVEPAAPGLPGFKKSLTGFAPPVSHEDVSQLLYVRGTMNSLMSIIQNMRGLPGRKAIILFSDGVPIAPRGDEIDLMIEILHRVADLANRSSVVLNCVDARGLQTLSPQAADAAAGGSMMSKFEGFDAQQDGLIYLAKQTGGRVGINGNDLSWDVARVLDDLNGYYLIGYKPHGGTFHKEGQRSAFHRIQVRVKQRGLAIRSRTGFYGETDAETSPKPQSDGQQLVSALKSPFGMKDIPLRLTLQFLSNGPKQSRISTRLHIDAHSIAFEKRADGNYHATLELLLTGHDEDGRPVETADNTIEVNMPEKQYQVALQSGFVLAKQVPVTRSGAAQVRAAVRDVTSGRLGSTSGFLLLPDLKKKHLVLGTIVLGTTDDVTSPANSAVRVFTADQPVPYQFTMFNPKTANGNLAEVETQVKVFHEGREVWASEPMVTKAEPGATTRELVARSNLHLTDLFEPGEYYLQVVAKDMLAGKKAAPSMQWINFDVSR